MSRRGRPPYPDILTPREWEVLALLREGLSNPEIAERLGISRDGVKFHVSEILTKLGVASREEASSWSAERRPWWAAALVPVGLLWRKTCWLVVGGVLVAAVAGLGLLAVLLLRSGGESEFGPHQLAYFGSDGALLLVDADTGTTRKVADNGTCGAFSRLEWSPKGDLIACIGSDAGETSAMDRVVIRDADGNVVGRVEEAGLNDFYWSPSGDAFLYGVELFVEPPSTSARHYRIADASGQQIADLGAWDLTGAQWPGWAAYGFPFWSPDGRKIAFKRSLQDPMTIYSIDAPQQETVVNGNFAPLAWALGGYALIVAEGYVPPATVGESPSYNANIMTLDLMAAAAGAGTPVHAAPAAENLTRIDALDNGVQFWVAPGGERAVYVTRGQRANGLPGLGVVDLRTGEAAPIADSLITYGSDVIPSGFVNFTSDGKWVYWVGGDNNGYRARIDGSGLEQVVSLDTLAFDWSPDHRMVSYVSFTTDGVTDTNTLYIVLPDGRKRVIDERRTSGGAKTTVPLGYAWRPAP